MLGLIITAIGLASGVITIVDYRRNSKLPLLARTIVLIFALAVSFFGVFLSAQTNPPTEKPLVEEDILTYHLSNAVFQPASMENPAEPCADVALITVDQTIDRGAGRVIQLTVNCKAREIEDKPILERGVAVVNHSSALAALHRAQGNAYVCYLPDTQPEGDYFSIALRGHDGQYTVYAYAKTEDGFMFSAGEDFHFNQLVFV